ncbi:Kef-type potassium/proton antiporter, CPA2 family [Chitinophaga costaii]|uniref:Kef-type potassium/proton antiporter, CPA2 family n=1 Tax=Chitinophaga costaii TaxID=1335309 RepID=A0A1C4G0T9_9BACT|nr:monovalent cation:proton antiporter-2 (CPA2) family protein [Chitinophaga costaii]PUZ19950.1 potassium transporter [Chitinophaga costaii]SCC61808.1 Kef-type potassium/proton antiporter, CPA2 family [Chitinophaga costaii]
MHQHTIFFQAMVFLAAAVVCVPLAKRIGMGSVLGYLLAGIIIGPAVLGVIGTERHAIMEFAEFGVVMMLFLVGLELEPKLLWKMKASVLGLGSLQVVITAVVLSVLAFLLGLDPRIAAMVGMTLCLSSTAIVLQSLKEKGLLDTTAGENAFAVLLFQDIAVIPMMAIFPLLAPRAAPGGHSEEATAWLSRMAGWQQSLIALGGVAGIIICGYLFVRPLLNIVARTGIRELFTATALLLVISVTVLMTMVGLSPALGAFLGGVVLANSEYRHELQADIEPFKGLLLGLFFMAVGATIDFKLILEKPLLILGLVLGVMLVKTLVLLALGKFFTLSFRQNLLFSLALCQVGEFSFVLISFIRTTYALEPAVTNLITVVVAVSMVLTPLVLMIYEKWLGPLINDGPEDVVREADVISERSDVIICGFGRFGNMAGRFIRANGINATILDMDSDRVDTLRKLGMKVYYGDGTRHDMLLAAGADTAKIIILALDTAEKNMDAVKVVKKHFPHLRMYVRAVGNLDSYELMDAGVLHIYRETSDTSLRMGADVLVALGYRAYHTQRAARLFLRHDDRLLKELSSIHDDSNLFEHQMRQRIADLQQMMESDKRNMLREDVGWDTESLQEDKDIQ